jgi:hypothetical protein
LRPSRNGCAARESRSAFTCTSIRDSDTRSRAKTYGDVVLLDVHEVEKIGHYVPPHRYTYDQTTAALRPDEWPLY